MLLQGCDYHVQAMGGVTGGIQSSLGSGQGPRARGITTGYRNTAQPRSPTPAFLKTRQGIQNAHLRFTIALHPGYSKERVLAVAKLPRSDPHLHPPAWTRSLRSCGCSIWTLWTSSFSFSSHISVFVGCPVPDSKCSIHRWASRACPRMLFGPQSAAAIGAPSMAS